MFLCNAMISIAFNVPLVVVGVLVVGVVGVGVVVGLLMVLAFSHGDCWRVALFLSVRHCRLKILFIFSIYLKVSLFNRSNSGRIIFPALFVFVF